MRRISLLLAIAVPLAALPAQTTEPASAKRPAANVGYDDTPKLPDSKWHVHDGKRPQPRVVTPGSGTRPPTDAIVLFDGTTLDQWTGRDDKAQWEITDDGAMVVNGTGDIQTRREFGDCQVHLEWATPAQVKGDSQGRGNSGVFFMGRYEVQILDSYDNPTYPDGQAGALYGQQPPRVNASRGPGKWQTYDLVFEAPRFADDGALVRPARVTVFHNGVMVHHAAEFLGATRHRANTKYEAHAPTGALRLQDHGNPMRFRNIWVRPLSREE
ncbi:MAG: DUF1080 domain-containing protein [Planctomycetota bacterium]